MEGCSCVIHLAGGPPNGWQGFLPSYPVGSVIDFSGTVNLARQAVAAGVKRFIFVSSVAVHGDFGQEFVTEASPTGPCSVYGKAKLDAELMIEALGQQTGLEIVIIRTPSVYGPSATGGLATLGRLVNSRMPLPFKGVENQRSYLFVLNLVDFLIHCINNPFAANQKFVVADNETVSTPMLLTKISAALDQEVRLFNVPLNLLTNVAWIFGKKSQMQNLCSSLCVDASR